MTGRFARASLVITLEFRTQIRSGLTALYFGMPLVWIIIARLISPDSRALVVLIGVYADPVMMGSIFTGAFLTRERDQGLLTAWAVTPLDAGGWLFGRVLVIAVQGTLSGLILVLGAGVPGNIILLIPSLFLASACAALNGLILARPFRDIMTFFVAGGMASSLICLPIAGGYFRPGWIWLVTGPAWPGWSLMASALNRPAPGPKPLMLIPVLAAWTVLLFLLTRIIYERGFFRRPGGGGE